MDKIFYYTGWLLWNTVAVLIGGRILYSYLATLSHFCCAMYAVFTWKRCRLVKWYLVPSDFMTQWLTWTWDGVPDELSNDHFVWTGIFKCKFHMSKEKT